MKSALFVRPNLKLFLLAALLLVVVTELIQPGHSEFAVMRVYGRQPGGAVPVQRELSQLLEAARTRPSAELYMQISECHRQLRNFKEAVRYLRRAEKMGFEADDIE